MAKTVTVSLGPHYEEFIQDNIAGGRYNNASEVRLAAFCAAIDEGDASPDVVNFDEEAFLQELKAR